MTEDSRSSHASNDAAHAAAHNACAWDALVRQGAALAQPAADADFRDPLKTVDPVGWLGESVAGYRVLCLAAGGGRQSALYAAAGADVTVVDISEEMLRLDREVASARNLAVRTVRASMDDLSMFSNAEFDVVVHPVSTCYVPRVLPVYEQVARLLRQGGLYISQHKSPVSLQVEPRSSGSGYRIIEPYYRQGPLPASDPCRLRERGTLEFLHRWEELIGGLCRAGFVIEDLVEPLHADPQAATGSLAHRSQFVAPYVRVKARRVAETEDASQSGQKMP